MNSQTVETADELYSKGHKQNNMGYKISICLYIFLKI